MRLDVAVDHLLFVGVLEAHRRLRDVMAGMHHRQRPLALHQLGQVLALDVLHREDEKPSRRRDAVRLDHILMVQPGGRLDLP